MSTNVERSFASNSEGLEIILTCVTMSRSKWTQRVERFLDVSPLTCSSPPVRPLLVDDSPLTCSPLDDSSP